MSLVIWTYIFGGATIFALVVGVFSVWNGRMTRRELREVIEQGNIRTHALLERMNSRMEETDRSHTALLERMNSRMEETDRSHTALLERIALHMQEMDRRHTELLSQLLKQAS